MRFNTLLFILFTILTVFWLSSCTLPDEPNVSESADILPDEDEEENDDDDDVIYTLVDGAFIVNSLSDVVASDGVITLREAIEAANTNTAVGDAPAGLEDEKDIIQFDLAALQSQAGASNMLTITLDGKELEITDDVSIIGPGPKLLAINANEKSRCFKIHGTGAANLTGMTITGGKEVSGGGIYSTTSGTVKLKDVNITGNKVTDPQGSIACGGAIYHYGRKIIIKESSISNNESTGNGGGIWIGNTMVEGATLLKMEVINVLIENNKAGRYGGGAYSGGTLILTNSVLVGNKSKNGGGVYVMSGGGWYKKFKSFNSTIAGNTAENKGGGILNDNHYTHHFSAFICQNTIVAKNIAPNNANIYSSFAVVGNTNWIDGDPGFVRNPSGSDNGDVHLSSGSPCIDKGGKSGAENGFGKQKDMDYEPRKVNGIVDIGADEYQ